MGNCIINRVSNLSSIEQQISTLDNAKQDKLVSGTNIKTINSTSLLGSGNINLDSSYVKLDGSTNMTGNLKINIPASAVEPPSSITERYIGFYGTDSSSNAKTFLSSRIASSGDVATRLSTRHSTSGTQEILIISIDSEGTRTISFTTPEAWRVGLGLPEPMSSAVAGTVTKTSSFSPSSGYIMKCCKWGRTVTLYLDFLCSQTINTPTTIANITTSAANKYSPAFDINTNVSPNVGTGNPYIKITTSGAIQLGGYTGSDQKGIRATITYVV